MQKWQHLSDASLFVWRRFQNVFTAAFGGLTAVGNWVSVHCPGQFRLFVYRTAVTAASWNSPAGPYLALNTNIKLRQGMNALVVIMYL